MAGERTVSFCSPHVRLCYVRLRLCETRQSEDLNLVTMIGGHDGIDQYPGNSEGPKDSLHLVPPQGVKGLLEVNEDRDCLTILMCPASLDHMSDGSDVLLTRMMGPEAILIDH